ncbi:MAG: HDOD domain-containing protein [Proteobacteria bacterium]|nr:HDOD domain-containing protein [Pseudomonadota bacterium]
MSDSGTKDRQAIFEGLSEQDRNTLYSLAPIKMLAPGDILIREGDTDQTAYVVLDGKLRVVRDMGGQEEEIALLQQGDWVGEIAFTMLVPRTASVVAAEKSRVMALHKSTLNALNEKTQLYFFKRLNDLASARVGDLARKEKDLHGTARQLVDYIQTTRQRTRAEYAASDMIQGVIGKTPRLPDFARDLIVGLVEKKQSPAEAAEKIKTGAEPAETVLRIANSHYYGFQNPLADIRDAMAFLGFNEVYRLLMTVGIRRTMPDTPFFRKLHRHAVVVSHLAFRLSQASQVGRPIEIATIGLMHELGLCVLRRLMEANPNLGVFIQAMDGALMGALLLESWDLPPAICQAVEYQCHPEFAPPARLPQDVRDNVSLLYLAHLCHDRIMDEADPGTPVPFLEEYLRVFGWGGSTLEDVTARRLLPGLLKKIDTYPVFFRQKLEALSAG